MSMSLTLCLCHITSKRVTSLRCPSLRFNAMATQLLAYRIDEAVVSRLQRCTCQIWPAWDSNSRPPAVANLHLFNYRLNITHNQWK